MMGGRVTDGRVTVVSAGVGSPGAARAGPIVHARPAPLRNRAAAAAGARARAFTKVRSVGCRRYAAVAGCRHLDPAVLICDIRVMELCVVDADGHVLERATSA
jgi:hypothetical protein